MKSLNLLKRCRKPTENFCRMPERQLKDPTRPIPNFMLELSAALLEDDSIVIGSNQENAAYPSGLCAERVTLFQAKSNYPDLAVKTLAITAQADHFDIDHPITPCGACRQVIAEVQQRQDQKIRIIMQGETGSVMVVNGIEHLLPLMFKEENLKRSKTKK